MTFPVPMKDLSRSISTALAPVIEQYLAGPKEQISALTDRVDGLEQRMEKEGLTRSQHRSIQRVVAQKVREILEELPDTTRAQHFANIYGALKDKYNVGSYMDIPRDRFMQAMQLIASYDGSGRNWWTD